MPRTNWRISMITLPRLEIRIRASRSRGPPTRAAAPAAPAAPAASAVPAVLTSDICTSATGILAGADMVGEVRPEATARSRRLLLAGLAVFAVVLGLYVIYTVIHPKSFTMDPVDLAVYRSGGLIV